MTESFFKLDTGRGYKTRYHRKCVYNSPYIINIISPNKLNKYFRGICEFGSLACVNLAVARGATNLSSGLFVACSKGKPDRIPVIKYLISRGTGRLGRCLSAAASMGDYEGVKTLIRAGARSHPNIFEAIAYGGNIRILQRILVYNVNDNYNVALYHACNYGRADMVNFILDTCEIDIESVIEELNMALLAAPIKYLLTTYKPPIAYRFRIETDDSDSSTLDDTPAPGEAPVPGDDTTDDTDEESNPHIEQANRRDEMRAFLTDFLRYVNEANN